MTFHCPTKTIGPTRYLIISMFSALVALMGIQIEVEKIYHLIAGTQRYLIHCCVTGSHWIEID